MALLRALSAEQLKLKRTLALWLAPLMPLVIIALQIAIILQRPEMFRKNDPAGPWPQFVQQTVMLWLLLLFPLFTTLETALLSQLEHGTQQWKHLFALPIRRGAIYAAKQMAGLGLMALSMIALGIYTGLAGLGLRLLVPGIGFEAPVPWAQIVRSVSLTYVASWLIISIHTWVALRWRSFVVATAVGIVAMIVAVVVIQSDYAMWYPWTLPAQIGNDLADGKNPLWQIAAGGLGGIVVALAAGWDVTRRDVL